MLSEDWKQENSLPQHVEPVAESPRAAALEEPLVIAVDETVILLTLSLPSLLIHLLKAQRGGAAE